MATGLVVAYYAAAAAAVGGAAYSANRSNIASKDAKSRAEQQARDLAEAGKVSEISQDESNQISRSRLFRASYISTTPTGLGTTGTTSRAKLV